MNAAKSKFVAGFPALRSQTMTWDVRGKVVQCSINRIPVKGPETHAHFAAKFDGKEHKVTGTSDLTGVILGHSKSGAVLATFTQKGKPVYAYRMSVSSDHRVLTIRSIDPKTLSDLTSTVIYDRDSH